MNAHEKRIGSAQPLEAAFSLWPNDGYSMAEVIDRGGSLTAEWLAVDMNWSLEYATARLEYLERIGLAERVVRPGRAELWRTTERAETALAAAKGAV